MADLENHLRRYVSRHNGLLRLKPCMVARGYRGGGRLAGKGPGCVRRRDGRCLVERWIASSTCAGWGDPNTLDGLSVLAEFRPKTYLRDALRALPEALLGAERASSHQGEFRVLTKVLDAYDPIGFHFHQKDQDVQAAPQAFPGERFGKDEAYYFLPGPKGAWPYTHVGTWPNVTDDELIAAMASGREALLEISPYFLQRSGMGFFVPAGLVHSPGTALTLEIQQPSDVGAGFDLPEQPGGTPSEISLKTAGQALLRHVDLNLCRLPDLVNRLSIAPVPAPWEAGLECQWIVPPQVTPKFSAKRMVAHTPCTCRQEECFALLAWSGLGTINGLPVAPGGEFFVSHAAARQGIRIEPGPAGLEFFAIFAASCQKSVAR
jgi:hypothetical protein